MTHRRQSAAMLLLLLEYFSYHCRCFFETIVGAFLITAAVSPLPGMGECDPALEGVTFRLAMQGNAKAACEAREARLFFKNMPIYFYISIFCVHACVYICASMSMYISMYMHIYTYV